MVWWKIVLWMALVVVGCVFLYLVRSILFPFILAFIISALLEPTVRKLRMRGFSRGKAVSLVFFAFFLVVGAIGVWITPVLANQVSTFTSRIESYTRTLAQEDPSNSVFIRWNPAIEAKSNGASDQFDQVLEQMTPVLKFFGQPTTSKGLIDLYVQPNQKQISGYVQKFFQGFLGFLSTAASQIFLALFTPLLVWLMLSDMDRLRATSATWIPQAIRAETISVLQEIGDVFLRYLRGVTQGVALYAVIATLWLTFLGAPYSIILGLVFAVLYLLPFVGGLIIYLSLFVVTYLSGQTGPWFYDFGNSLTYAMFLVIAYAAVLETYNQVVYPRLVGGAVGLGGIASIFVIFAGGALFGVVGMLIAFPLAGAAKVVLEKLLKVTTSSGTETLGLPVTPLRHRTMSEV